MSYTLKNEMYSIKPTIVALTLLLSFSAAGCITSIPAGKPFTRLSHERFELGKATKAEIHAIMGKPVGKSRMIKNGKPFESINYHYATRSSINVLLVRVQTFFFSEDILVGHLYSSNFDQDTTDFEEGQMESIQKGKTKIDEVLKKLGTPSGESIYPITEDKDERKIMYFYPKRKTDSVIYTKEVFILYKSDGIVSDILFSESLP